jgi:inorganic pyrophosphatase
MANINHPPSRTMLNLLHVLPAFADIDALRLNVIVELNSMTINKYELITETGHLKLDRVGCSNYWNNDI